MKNKKENIARLLGSLQDSTDQALNYVNDRRILESFIKGGIRLKVVVIAGSAALLVFFILSIISGNRPNTEKAAGPKILYYTCSMHPQIKEENPGYCPICHMKLVPFYAEDHQDHSADNRAADETSETVTVNSVRISTRRQQLIGVRTMVTELKAASFDIQTSGRVAFDPELAVAIREYLTVIGDAELRRSALSRLRLLGMGDEEIRNLSARRGSYESLYLPAKGGTAWVYATIYEGEAALIKPGMHAEIRVAHAPDMLFEGKVRSLSPVVDPKSRAISVRIELPASQDFLRPDSYVDVILKSPLGSAILVPRSALVDTGSRRMVFVVHEGTRFEARPVVVGPQSADGFVILQGLAEGETIVTSGTFLIDSESQMKAALNSMGANPHTDHGAKKNDVAEPDTSGEMKHSPEKPPANESKKHSEGHGEHAAPRKDANHD